MRTFFLVNDKILRNEKTSQLIVRNVFTMRGARVSRSK